MNKLNDIFLMENSIYKVSTIWIILGISTFLFALVWLAPDSYNHHRVENFTAWHTLAECFAVAIAASIFSITWQSQIDDDKKFPINVLSVTFLAVALIDTFHLLSFKDMPVWITESGHGKGIPFWFFARFAAIFGLLFLVIPCDIKSSAKLSRKILLSGTLVYVFIPVWLVFSFPNFQTSFLKQGIGLTLVKISLEWGLIFLLGITLFLNNFAKNSSKYYDPGTLNLAICLSILSELCFTLYSNVSGVFSVLGHIYKIVAYFFLYQSIVLTNLRLPYKMVANNQELLQQITTHIKQIFLLTSGDRNEILYVSPAFEEFTGRTAMELIANPSCWIEAIHPNDRSEYSMSLKETNNIIKLQEFRMVHRNGTVYWVSQKTYPICDNNGNILRLASICENITDKKLLQQELTASERTLENVINNIPVMIAYWGKDKYNIFSNNACAAWFGHTTDEMKGKNIEEVLGSEHYNNNLRHMDAVLRGHAQHFENKLISPNGKLTYTITDYVPDIVDGNVVGFFVSVSDVTSIKLAQEQLQVSEDRLLRSQSMGRIGSWEVNLTSGDVWWSNETYHVYGLTPGDKIDAKTTINLIHEEDVESVNTAWQKSLYTQSVYDHEHRIITPTKELRYVWEYAKITKDQNSNIIIIGCSQDITERKTNDLEREKLHKQLMQSQKMESIGHLTGGVAHDFNNMLGAILGYSELINEMIQNSEIDTRKFQRYISTIITASTRAKELISQMLLFSRKHQDTNEKAVPVLIKPIVKEVVYLLRSSIPATIKINYHMPDEGLQVAIHPVQLHQILLNLAINARDAIEGYGNINITVVIGSTDGKCVSCHKPFNGDYIDITVHDDGGGMDATLISRIFDPFFTTKEPGKGTGMGLSVVHGIVHDAGGHIDINSSYELGTSIRILLPCKNIASNPIGKPSIEGISNISTTILRGKRVLVVDDEQAITSLLADLLELHGMSVTTCNQSPDALTRFTSNPDSFDLVITDETMPDLSGLDMAVCMMKKRPNIPIIICTGYSEKVNSTVAKEKGIAGFMYKPIQIKELLALMKDVIKEEYSFIKSTTLRIT